MQTENAGEGRELGLEHGLAYRPAGPDEQARLRDRLRSRGARHAGADDETNFLSGMAGAAGRARRR
jgi:hypothetical protein